MTTGPSVPRVLIVDDEPPIRKLLRVSLVGNGFQVLEAGDGAAALALVRRNAVDVMVLDLGLPVLDGFEVIRQLRESGSPVPIIVLSARADEAGKVKALNMGADDFVTKPFGMEELLARIHAALRHRLQQEGERPIFKASDLTVDLIRRNVMVRGEEVKLTPKEYDLLRLLIANAGKVLTHNQILKEIWANDSDVKYLRIYIRALRQKIEPSPERPILILTEQGVGYRLRAAD